LPKVSIYPNPTEGDINITLPANENSKVEIHSMLGQLLLSQDTSGLRGVQLSLDNTHADGVYLVRITINNTTQTQKIVLKR
jgi:hypothetical protein